MIMFKFNLEGWSHVSVPNNLSSAVRTQLHATVSLSSLHHVRTPHSTHCVVSLFFFYSCTPSHFLCHPVLRISDICGIIPVSVFHILHYPPKFPRSDPPELRTPRSTTLPFPIVALPPLPPLPPPPQRQNLPVKPATRTSHWGLIFMPVPGWFTTAGVSRRPADLWHGNSATTVVVMGLLAISYTGTPVSRSEISFKCIQVYNRMKICKKRVMIDCHELLILSVSLTALSWM